MLADHFQEVSSLAFTPDAHWPASGGLDRQVRLWDMKAEVPAAEPRLLEGHSDVINALAITTDGDKLVSAGDVFPDNTARLWDLDAEDPAAQPILLPGQGVEATSIAITANGRWLILAGADGQLRFRRLKIDDLIDSACQSAGRNLTLDEWEQFFPEDVYRQTCLEWPSAGGESASGGVDE